VLASTINAEVVRHDCHIDRLIIRKSGRLAQLIQLFSLRRQKFDVVLNLIFNRTTSIGLLARFICPDGITVSQGPAKYAFYFNHFISLERGKKHTGELYIELVENVFGLHFDDHEYNYDIVIPESVQQAINEEIQAWLTKTQVPGSIPWEAFVLLNISASDVEKSFSAYQAQAIARHLVTALNIPTLVIAAPWDAKTRTMIQQKLGSPLCLAFPESGNAHLLEITQIVSKALCIITPDTAVIHMASAKQTPVLGVYTPLQYVAEWFPFRVAHKMVMAENRQPVSSISETVLYQEIETFIKKCLHNKHE
jgi:ADP-heptose:LPS heptosyltransferase